MLALILKRLGAYALPLLLIAAGALVVRGVQLRIEKAEHRAALAEARIAEVTSAYESSLAALRKLEQESVSRKAATEVAIKEVETVRVETVEKLVYIESAPTPASCPAAIEFLTKFGEEF